MVSPELPELLGLLLLALWFLKKLGGNVGKAIVTEGGDVLRRERLKSRPILTVFGEPGDIQLLERIAQADPLKRERGGCMAPMNE